MERNGDRFEGDKSHPAVPISGETPAVNMTFFLDQVGEVVLTLNSDGLSWNPIKSIHNEPEESSCLGIKLDSKSESAIKFSDVYAVEFIDWGLVHESILANAGRCLSHRTSEMYRFTVHGVHRSNSRPSVWAPSVYTFGHKDLNACQIWVNRISASLNTEKGRPKSLLTLLVLTRFLFIQRAGKEMDVELGKQWLPYFFMLK